MRAATSNTMSKSSGTSQGFSQRQPVNLPFAVVSWLFSSLHSVAEAYVDELVVALLVKLPLLEALEPRLAHAEDRRQSLRARAVQDTSGAAQRTE